MNTTIAYHLPADTYKDWARCETRAFSPDARQQLVIDAVRSAIEDAGLYYTRDVYNYCVIRLGIVDSILEINAKAVEGGEVGMDLYYARKYLDAQKRFAAEDAALAALKPYVGKKLGTLVLSDFKRYTGAVVTAIDGVELTIEAKRGSHGYRFISSTLSVRFGIERAHEKGLRKDSYEQFCSSEQSPPKRKSKAQATDLALAF